MKVHIAASIAAAVLAALVICGTAQAQENNPPVIVEVFGCSFNDGSDFDDLMAVTERWNVWADEHDVTDYSANLLIPHAFSAALRYDVLWLGVYPDAAAFGAGEAQWLADGQDMNAEFGEVVTCDTHIQFAGVSVHLPAEQPDANDGMVNLTAFQDCTLINQSSAGEALAAHTQWGNYVAENGTEVFMGAIFPVAGEDPAAEYDYKAVTGFSSAVNYGDYLATVIPGGLQRSNQLFGRVTDCDSPRLYQSIEVRASEDED